MKRSKNRATRLRVLASAVIACFALSSASAAIITNSVVDYAADFEAYVSGEGISGPAGQWVADTNVYMVATNSPVNNYLQAKSIPYPLPSSTHNIVAKLQTEGAGVTNHFDGAGEASVWIDMNIQMVPSDGLPAGITNDNQIQTAIIMNTNGNLEVYCTQSDNDTSNPSNVWVEIDFSGAIETGAWHRLTVSLAYKRGFLEYNYFKVEVDGTAVSNAIGWRNIDDVLPTFGGPWLEGANRGDAADHLRQVQFSGTGYLDDFVVTNAAVNFDAPVFHAGTPGWWLDAHGLEQNDTVNGTMFTMNDGLFAWQKRLIGANPLVSNEWTVAIENINGTNVVKWMGGGTIDYSAPPILIEKTTNLVDGVMETNVFPRNNLVAGENTWSDPAPGDGFYRLKVTTD